MFINTDAINAGFNNELTLIGHFMDLKWLCGSELMWILRTDPEQQSTAAHASDDFIRTRFVARWSDAGGKRAAIEARKEGPPERAFSS